MNSICHTHSRRSKTKVPGLPTLPGMHSPASLQKRRGGGALSWTSSWEAGSVEILKLKILVRTPLTITWGSEVVCKRNVEGLDRISSNLNLLSQIRFCEHCRRPEFLLPEPIKKRDLETQLFTVRKNMHKSQLVTVRPPFLPASIILRLYWNL